MKEIEVCKIFSLSRERRISPTPPYTHVRDPFKVRVQSRAPKAGADERYGSGPAIFPEFLPAAVIPAEEGAAAIFPARRRARCASGWSVRERLFFSPLRGGWHHSPQYIIVDQSVSLLPRDGWTMTQISYSMNWRYRRPAQVEYDVLYRCHFS